VNVNAKRSLNNAKGTIMDVGRSNEGSKEDGGRQMPSRLSEKRHAINEDSGYQMQMEEVSFNQIDLKWASYITPHEKVLTFNPGKSAIVSHFVLIDTSGKVDKGRDDIAEKQFVVYREPAELYELCVTPTRDKGRSFFELVMSDQFFHNLVTEESPFLSRFLQDCSNHTPSYDFTAHMTPAMFGIIREMQYSPYSGHLKGVFLESKAIELFLMQVSQLDQQYPARRSVLRPADIESLHAVRDYMMTHYDQPCTIIELARKAGINQMKLKNGFKELFNNTVFGYLSEVRMQEAKKLLLDEKLPVHEVADRIGYKHPQHFTVAFKKKFGILPGNLKN
jgi:AraC-like DNA-binding protein